MTGEARLREELPACQPAPSQALAELRGRALDEAATLLTPGQRLAWGYLALSGLIGLLGPNYRWNFLNTPGGFWELDIAGLPTRLSRWPATWLELAVLLGATAMAVRGRARHLRSMGSPLAALNIGLVVFLSGAVPLVSAARSSGVEVLGELLIMCGLLVLVAWLGLSLAQWALTCRYVAKRRRLGRDIERAVDEA